MAATVGKIAAAVIIYTLMLNIGYLRRYVRGFYLCAFQASHDVLYHHIHG